MVAGRPTKPELVSQIKGQKQMKKTLLGVLTLLCATSVFAFDNDDSIASWRSIVGVITAPGVDNPVAGIRAGAGPWSVRSGRAQVNLSNGATFLDVAGLVLKGSNSSGTPGPLTPGMGSLVRNPHTTPAPVPH